MKNKTKTVWVQVHEIKFKNNYKGIKNERKRR